MSHPILLPVAHKTFLQSVSRTTTTRTTTYKLLDRDARGENIPVCEKEHMIQYCKTNLVVVFDDSGRDRFTLAAAAAVLVAAVAEPAEF